MSPQNINDDGTLWRIFDVAPLTTEDGKLPGLFGNAVEMPAHLYRFSGGDGTEYDPYIITTAEQLAKLATFINTGTTPFSYPNVYYRLGNDIDISCYGEGFNNGEGWMPIGNTVIIDNVYEYTFRGNFDGDGYKVTNLYIYSPTLEYAGLFGWIGSSGSVINLGVEDANVSALSSHGARHAGAIAGWNSGVVSNCYSTGYIYASGYYAWVGGIVGYSNISAGGSINRYLANCYSTASVVAEGSVSIIGTSVYAGGIAGYNNSDIYNCYSIGSVYANSNNNNNNTSHAGGIVGRNNNGSIMSCVALNPKIECYGTNRNFGRVAGLNFGANAAMDGNFAFDNMINPDGGTTWDNISIDLIDGGDIDVATIHADGTLGGQFSTYGGWTSENGKLPGLFGNVVDMPEHLMLLSEFEGDGTDDSPYLIKTAAEMERMATLINDRIAPYFYEGIWYELVNDIDLSEYGVNFNDGLGWMPVGFNSDNTFKGNFNGKGKVISILFINR